MRAEIEWWDGRLLRGTSAENSGRLFLVYRTVTEVLKDEDGCYPSPVRVRLLELKLPQLRWVDVDWKTFEKQLKDGYLEEQKVPE